MIDCCVGEKCNLAVSDKQYMRNFFEITGKLFKFASVFENLKYFSDPISSCELRGQALCVSVTLGNVIHSRMNK